MVIAPGAAAGRIVGMAKAKKSSDSPASDEQNPTRSKASSRRKPPAKAAGQASKPEAPQAAPVASPQAEAPAAAPLVNPAEAAANAARMLAAKQKLQEEAEGAAPAKESATFKNLKQKLSASGQNLSSALGGTLGHHRSNLPHHFDKQAARNQTLGGVGRFNVPRRTNG